MFRQYKFIKIWIWFWREINLYLLFHILKLRLKEEYIYKIDHKIFIFFSVNVIISLMNYVLLVHLLKS